ncbi:hypothetical protein ACLEE6_12030 [Lonsdalea quercina]|uniref:hypothetical protein n=1 Tax=Lonsdalea quercina TaxID=71657 RepID=UPI003974C7F3
MIEKIKISLWDIFTFFMTGVFFGICSLSFLRVTDRLPESKELFDSLIRLPATYIVVVIPIVLILFGILLEPLANYFDRYAGKYIFFWLKLDKSKRKKNETIMEVYIKKNCLGDLSGRIDDPFFLCKEYVETKQLSTTFMVFLARFGFYRNCSFIAFFTGFLYFLDVYDGAAFVWSIVGYFVSALLKKRSDEFYSYQAGAVYSAFLIDNLNWPSKKLNDNAPHQKEKVTKRI